MKFVELLETVREKFGQADISQVVGRLAFQFDITGEEGGVFYAEVKDGVLSIEPYEYIDRDARMRLSGNDLLQLMNGKLDPIAAFTLGRLKVDGDLGKAMELQKLL